MSKQLIVALFVLSSFVSTAQRTEYYKLSRIQKNSASFNNVSGGQFLTFINDVCFESDSKGDGVGHGYLSYSKVKSNSQFSTYQGSSYWGSSTTFKFNADKSVLNVVLENGDIYVYKRATPPAGQTTCSLIRKKSSGSSGGGGGGGNVLMPPPTPYSPQPTPPPSSPTPNPSPRYVERTYQCTYCHGKGSVPDCDGGVVDFSGRTKYCSECGKNVTMCHVHKRCPSCGGKGTYTKMERVD